MKNTTETNRSLQRSDIEFLKREGYTKTQIRHLKKLHKILSIKKNYTYPQKVWPLEERKDLIIEEWTSKKGVDYIKFKNNGMNKQIEKKSIKYYFVDENNNIKDLDMVTLRKLYDKGLISKEWFEQMKDPFF